MFSYDLVLFVSNFCQLLSLFPFDPVVLSFIMNCKLFHISDTMENFMKIQKVIIPEVIMPVSYNISEKDVFYWHAFKHNICPDLMCKRETGQL